MGACAQSITVPLCSSFLLTLFPCASTGPPQAAVLQDKPSPAWAPLHGPQFVQDVFTCSDVGSSRGRREIAMVLSMGNREISAPATWGASSPSFLLRPWCSQDCFSHLFFSSALPAYVVFCSFLNTFSQRRHQLGGSILDLAGPSRVWHGETSGSSHGGYLLQLSGCRHLHTYTRCKRHMKNIQPAPIMNRVT